MTGRTPGSVRWVQERERWQVRISTTGPDGRRIRKVAYFQTKAEAEAKRIEMLAAQQKGVLSTTRGRKPTLKAYLEDWSAGLARVRPSTAARYRGAARNHLIPHLGKVQVTKLTAAMVNRMVADMKAAGLADNTVANNFNVLNTALKDAVKHNLIENNPIQRADRVRVEQQEMHVLTEEQALILTEASERGELPYENNLWPLLLWTGLRKSEALGLRRSDYDREARTLGVRRQLKWETGRGYFLADHLKSKNGRRTIPLCDKACEALDRQWAWRLEARMAAGPEWDEQWGDLLFLHDKPEQAGEGRPGRVVGGNHLDWQFPRVLKAAGLPRIRIHDLRHSFASISLVRGVPVAVVADAMGDTVNQVHKTYSHMLDSGRQVLVDRLNAVARVG